MEVATLSLSMWKERSTNTTRSFHAPHHQPCPSLLRPHAHIIMASSHTSTMHTPTSSHTAATSPSANTATAPASSSARRDIVDATAGAAAMLPCCSVAAADARSCEKRGAHASITLTHRATAPPARCPHLTLNAERTARTAPRRRLGGVIASPHYADRPMGRADRAATLRARTPTWHHRMTRA